jgi:hypothetical protein
MNRANAFSPMCFASYLGNVYAKTHWSRTSEALFPLEVKFSAKKGRPVARNSLHLPVVTRGRPAMSGAPSVHATREGKITSIARSSMKATDARKWRAEPRQVQEGKEETCL